MSKRSNSLFLVLTLFRTAPVQSGGLFSRHSESGWRKNQEQLATGLLWDLAGKRSTEKQGFMQIGNDCKARHALEAGALVNGQLADPNIVMQKSETPLHRAASRGNYPIVNVLIKNKADLNIKDTYGYTALMRAAKNRHHDSVIALVNAGADVDLTSKSSLTALMLLQQSVAAPPATTRALIAASSQVNAQSRTGTTALRQAMFWGHTDDVQALLRAGADPTLEHKCNTKEPHENLVIKPPVMEVFKKQMTEEKEILKKTTPLPNELIGIVQEYRYPLICAPAIAAVTQKR